MGKLIWIILIVLGVYVGMTVYTEGTDHAFGGIFASGTNAGLSAEPHTTPMKRAEDSVRKSLDASVDRVERGLANAD